MAAYAFVSILILNFVDGDLKAPSVRLVNKGVSRHFGFVQFDDGQQKWRTACGSKWSDVNTELVCKDLGFESGKYSKNMMQLYGGNFTKPDNHVINCNSDDKSFIECLKRFHPEDKRCENRNFVAAYIVCTAGNKDNINFVYSPFYNNVIWYKLSHINKQLLVHGDEWSDRHDKLVSHQLGEGECKHEIIESDYVNVLIALKCNRTARSLDDCRPLTKKGKQLVRLICFTNFEISMSRHGLVEYFEIAHENVNFTITLTFEKTMSIMIGFNFLGTDSSCESLSFLPSQGPKPINYFEGNDVSDLEIINSTYFSIKYTSICEANKESELTNFEVVYAPLYRSRYQDYATPVDQYFIYLLIISIVIFVLRYKWNPAKIKRLVKFMIPNYY